MTHVINLRWFSHGSEVNSWPWEIHLPQIKTRFIELDTFTDKCRLPHPKLSSTTPCVPLVFVVLHTPTELCHRRYRLNGHYFSWILHSQLFICTLWVSSHANDQQFKAPKFTIDALSPEAETACAILGCGRRSSSTSVGQRWHLDIWNFTLKILYHLKSSITRFDIFRKIFNQETIQC